MSKAECKAYWGVIRTMHNLGHDDTVAALVALASGMVVIEGGAIFPMFCGGVPIRVGEGFEQRVATYVEAMP